MELVSIIISGLALLFSVCIFFLLDHRIKVLEKEKLEYEIQEYKRAKFKVDYQLLFGIHNLLHIENIGKVVAQNINILIEPSEDGDLIFNNGGKTYHIDQLDATEKHDAIPMQGQAPRKLKVVLTWDDKSGKGVTKNYYVEWHD